MVQGASFHHEARLLFSLVGVLCQQRRATWLWPEPLIAFILRMLPGQEGSVEEIQGSGAPQCLREPWRWFSSEWMSASVICPMLCGASLPQ